MPSPAEGLIIAQTDPATIRLLQQSFQALAPQGDRLVVSFYARLFERYPGVRSMFPAEMSAQRRKLLDTLAAVIDGLASPVTVRDQLRAMGKRHAGYGARPEHYPLVCDCLVDSMRDVAGPDWTDQLEDEWKRALELISRIMLDGASVGEAHGQPRASSPPIGLNG